MLPLRREPTISLCMIAKNEEEFIAQCIASVRAVICEVVLIDTGSSDNTVAIAGSMGARVYCRPWDDDFSGPRNLSIEMAFGDWILVLDADEAIAQEDHAQLKRLVQEPGTCYEFMQRHYSANHQMSGYLPVRGEYKEWERHYPGYFESNLTRLFPNNQGIHYRGRVHELVEHSIRAIGRHKVLRTRIPIHHYGHTPEVQSKKNKGSLYNPLGSAKIGDDPRNWQSYFELAVERNCSGNKAESIPAFLKAIELNPRYVPSWVNLGFALCELGKLPEAKQALETAAELDPRCEEAYCNLGVVFMRAKQYRDAAGCFNKAIELKETYVNAYCNLGKTYLLMGDNHSAEAVYRRALSVVPRCTPAKMELGAVCLLGGRFDEAQRILLEAIGEDSSISKAHYYLGKVYQSTAKAKEALEELETFCRMEEEAQRRGSAGESPQILSGVLQECETLRKSVNIP